jgi:3-phenylpropionate/cinnamic acid dioxygenase small subunit
VGYLTNEDYEDLPHDDGEAFAKLEAISRDRLYEVDRDRDGDIPFEDMLRYMNEIAALAEQFEITEIAYDAHPEGSYLQEFARFTRAVDYRLAQIRVRLARRSKRESVAIIGPTREKIQYYLERLKTEIKAADIPDKRRSALLDRIADFEAELTKRRVNLAAVMTVIALVSSVIHDNIETMVESPKIVQAISALFGAAKTEEDEASPKLAAPDKFKAIPDMRAPSRPARASLAFDDDLDADVPF